MAQVVAITTSGFNLNSPGMAELDRLGWQVVRNPHGRKLTEQEVSELLRTSRAELMVAGVEELTASVFEANPQLRVISRCGSGVDAVDMEAAKLAGIEVRRTPEAPAEAVAELTISLAIGVLRRTGEADRNLRAGEWRALMGRSFGRSRIGVVGLGHVGSRVAKVATTLGAKVGYADRYVQDSVYKRFPDIETLATWADVLSIHLPHDEETHHVIDTRIIDVLGPDGYLINTARGGLVDEVALYEALRSGRLAGAALDVFETEPYSGPLTGLSNVLLTCHMGSYATEIRAVMEHEALESVLQVIRSDDYR